MFGGALVLKFGLPRAVSKTPPFIAAAQGPTKIQPPSDATVQSGSDAGALLTKDSTSSAPVKVVSTTEEPVDGPTSYEAQLENLRAVMLDGETPVTGGRDAIANMTAVDAIYNVAGRG